MVLHKAPLFYYLHFGVGTTTTRKRSSWHLSILIPRSKITIWKKTSHNIPIHTQKPKKARILKSSVMSAPPIHKLVRWNRWDTLRNIYLSGMVWKRMWHYVQLLPLPVPWLRLTVAPGPISSVSSDPDTVLCDCMAAHSPAPVRWLDEYYHLTSRIEKVVNTQGLEQWSREILIANQISLTLDNYRVRYFLSHWQSSLFSIVSYHGHLHFD